MKAARTLLVSMAVASAWTLLAGMSGCRKKVDVANYNAAQWTNNINARGLTESEFVRLFAMRQAAEMTGSTVRITGTREVTIKLPDGSELKQFLDNAWTDARESSNRVEVCEKYLTALKQSQKDFSENAGPLDTNAIVAVVRDDQFLNQLEKYGTQKTNRVVEEPLVADLHVAYGRDSQRGMAYLTEGERARLGLDFPELRKLAIVNLHRILDAPRRVGDGPVYMIVADGTYESSLLLADKLWESQAPLVKGELVAAVPARDVLMFTGSGSPDGLKELRESASRVYKDASHAISRTLLVRRNGRWERFE